MSVNNGSTVPSFAADRRVREEIAAHRAKVYEVLQQHTDPAIREIGHLLASGTLTPHELMEDPQRAEELRRGALKLIIEHSSELRRRVLAQAGGSVHGPTGPARHDEGGPASRSDYTDPDNGAEVCQPSGGEPTRPAG